MTHTDAGALFVHEYSELQGELNHAGALRTSYAREARYFLNRDTYHKPQDRWGRLAVVVHSGDLLQLPPAPATSSMLAPLDGTGPRPSATQLLAGINRCGSMQAPPQAGFVVNEETAAVLHRPHHPAKAQCCTVRIILQRCAAAQPVPACACCPVLHAHLSRAFARYVA